MPGLIAASGSAWSYGGSILTFLFPMLLFIAVAGALYVLYTKPQVVPGSQYANRAVGATPQVRSVGANARAAEPAATGEQPAPPAASQPTASSGEAKAAGASGAEDK